MGRGQEHAATMRVCPKCLYRDADYWKPSYNNNPQGAVDCARFSELQTAELELAKRLLNSRGSYVTIGVFTYYYGKKAVFVHRVDAQLYKMGGTSVFRIPHEKSRRYSEYKRKGQLKLLEAPTP